MSQTETEFLLNDKWQEQLGQYHRLLVGFSGGLDSSVLLHNVANLPLLSGKVTAIHVNHGLSVNAWAWDTHCQHFCRLLGIPLIVKQIKCANNANIEEKARKERYAFFETLLTENDCLLIAHHLNDQAETLLLQLARGTGIDGLAAMPTIKKYARGVLLRPLLEYSRQRLEDYARFHQLKWVNDESNSSLHFSRNFLRHQVLPVLEKRWSAIVVKLATTSRHCQQAKANLEDLAKIDCPALERSPKVLALSSLKTLNPARITNVLRSWLRMHRVRMPGLATFNRLIKEVIDSSNETNPYVMWDGIIVRRYQQNLYLLRASSFNSLPSANVYPWYSFPNTLDLGQGCGSLIATPVMKGLVVPAENALEVRFRQGGELLHWHGQTKRLKKLFQEWQIPPWLRDTIPLLYINNQLACVVGYAVSDLFYQSSPDSAYVIYHRCQPSSPKNGTS